MEYISAAAVSRMLKKHLKAEFSSLKISVRKDGWSAIDVIVPADTDDDTLKAVTKIAEGYAGGDFDGMIDMRFSYTSWMHDGRLTPANSRGTIHNGGSHEAFNHPAPHPDAVEVRSGPDFVFVRKAYA